MNIFNPNHFKNRRNRFFSSSKLNKFEGLEWQNNSSLMITGKFVANRIWNGNCDINYSESGRIRSGLGRENTEKNHRDDSSGMLLPERSLLGSFLNIQLPASSRVNDGYMLLFFEDNKALKGIFRFKRKKKERKEIKMIETTGWSLVKKKKEQIV